LSASFYPHPARLGKRRQDGVQNRLSRPDRELTSPRSASIGPWCDCVQGTRHLSDVTLSSALCPKCPTCSPGFAM
jgi:hypothetical protein